MKVYIIQEFVRHEGSTIHSVYTSYHQAYITEQNLNEFNTDDQVWYEAEQFEVQTVPGHKQQLTTEEE